jgi:class 3 adenylate cyclase
MPSTAGRRQLATVLFLDIVGSTAIASEIGDTRWRAVLSRFRHAVRQELKRFDGREQDTTGDGFFATFAGPDQALRAAAAIAGSVQHLGLDVRCGIHVGECEEIEGRLGGIAVHIAARVMALAGPAEVLVTGTTKDLVAGSGATFEDRGTETLKGVDGRWSVWALRSVEVELPEPLAPEVAAERLSATAADAGRRHSRRIVLAALALVLAGLAAFEIVTNVGGAAASPPSVVELDPGTGRVVSAVHDHVLGCPCGANLWAVDGTLWERTGPDGSSVATRALSTGALQRTISLPPAATGITIGFGSVWAQPGCTVIAAPPVCDVDRFDELSGRRTASIGIHGDLRNGAITVGGGYVWTLDQDGVVTRIDPRTNRASRRFDTGAVETFAFASGGPYLWVCECFNEHDVLRYDPRSGTGRRFPLLHPLQRWRNSNAQVRRYLARTWVVGVDGHTGLIWFMNAGGATLAAWTMRTGEQAAPSLGLDGAPSEAALGRRYVWIAAGAVVDRVSLADGTKEMIPLPKGMNATGIAVDPVTGRVWVANGLAPVG